jgi:hypothetical protein
VTTAAGSRDDARRDDAREDARGARGRARGDGDWGRARGDCALTLEPRRSSDADGERNVRVTRRRRSGPRR